jgi:hypothetical protein
MYFFMFPRPQGKMSLPRTACWETKHLVGRKKISLSLFFFLVHWQSRNKEKSLFIIHSPVLVVRADVMSCRVE